MFGENVRNTCWRERYTWDDVERKHQCLGRMLETLVGGRGILGMMLRGSTKVLGRMSETHVGGSFFKKRFTRDDIKGRH